MRLSASQPAGEEGAPRRAPDPRVIAAVAPLLAGAARVVAPSAAVAAALAGHGVAVEQADLDTRRRLDAVALLADELDAAEPEGLLAGTAAALRPGGLLAVSSSNAVHASAHLGGPAGAGPRGLRDDELVRVLGHRGFELELLAAPGAAALLRGDPQGTYDPALDRLPSLLGAAPRLVAVGRLAASQRARSERFFATLPRKVVAAGVLCRDRDGRVLIVHDAFKQHWTIPGGVVDADEDPRSGAAREAWEEAGVRVEVGALLGVFAATWPDRLAFVFDATPAADAPGTPRPQHAHEVDDARWVDVDEALGLVAPYIRSQLERCLRHPGRAWRD